MKVCHQIIFLDEAVDFGCVWARTVLVEDEHADSVTRKKSPNVYKSCPNMISLEIW